MSPYWPTRPARPERADAEGAPGGRRGRPVSRSRSSSAAAGVRRAGTRAGGHAVRPPARAGRRAHGPAGQDCAPPSTPPMRARRDWAAWPWQDRGRGLPQGRRPALHVLARDAQRDDDAGPGQDRRAGRDRRAPASWPTSGGSTVRYAAELYAEQPGSPAGVWNQLDYRPLEGFVYAVTPFNFTAIAGNLPTAPVLMGGVAVWKPAATALRAAYAIMQLLEAAGLPPGVINFVPGDPRPGDRSAALRRRISAGIHFTGSTAVFQHLWQDGRRQPRGLPVVPAPGRRDGRQGLHRRASLGGPAGGGGCHRARRIRVPGAEVLGREPRLRAASRWPDLRDRVVAMMREIDDGRRARLPALRGRRHRPPRLRSHSRRHPRAARRTARVVEGGARATAWGISSRRRSSRPATRGTA